MEIKYGRKKSGIRRELKAKIDEWLETITDENVVKAVKSDVIVTGGAIASMLMGDQINDYDVYFRNLETTKLVAEYYVAKFNETVIVPNGGIPTVVVQDMTNIKGEVETCVVVMIKSSGVAEDKDYFEGVAADPSHVYREGMSVQDAELAIQTRANEEAKGKYRPVFLSQNAITLSNKMQLVTRFYGEPDKIHDNYDFQHAMSYYDYRDDNLVTPAEALECLLSRTLIYRGSLYPVASIFRVKKFLERGWRITAGQQLKIMWQISELDLKNFEIMRLQLVGVDQAYLWQLIAALKDVEPEKINSTYVAAIIDKIFD